MKLKPIKLISIILIALFPLAILAPIAHASELDYGQVYSSDSNLADYTAPSQFGLKGFWLAFIYPEYTDIHLWYSLYSYDTNKLTQSAKTGTTLAYAYDYSGQRVKLANGSTTTYYPSKEYNTDGTTPVKHIFAPNGQMVATVKGTGASVQVYSINTDHLTGANTVTNSTDVQQTLDYFPFGSIRIDQKAGTFDEQRKFAGSEYDADSGLNYMQARYYKSGLGRFISQDPVYLTIGSVIVKEDKNTLDKLLSDPQFLNSYSYARNNPLVYNDPSGRFPNPIKAINSVINSIKESINNYFDRQNQILSSPEYQRKAFEANLNGMVYLGEIGGRDRYFGIAAGSISNIGSFADDIANSTGKYVNTLDDIIPPGETQKQVAVVIRREQD